MKKIVFLSIFLCFLSPLVAVEYSHDANKLMEKALQWWAKKQIISDTYILSLYRLINDQNANPNLTLDAGDYAGWTVLHFAAQQGNKDFVDLFLSLSVDPTIKDSKNRTIVDVAQEDLKKELHNVVLAVKELKKVAQNPNSKEILDGVIDFFIKNKLDPNIQLPAGASTNDEYRDYTLLHFAAENNNVEAVKKLLVLADINPEPESYKGIKPLKLALFKDNLSIIKQFIAKNPNLVQGKDGEDLLAWALDNKRLGVIDILIEAGVDSSGHEQSIKRLREIEKAKETARNKPPVDDVIKAIKASDFEILEILFKENSDKFTPEEMEAFFKEARGIGAEGLKMIEFLLRAFPDYKKIYEEHIEQVIKEEKQAKDKAPQEEPRDLKESKEQQKNEELEDDEQAIELLGQGLFVVSEAA